MRLAPLMSAVAVLAVSPAAHAQTAVAKAQPEIATKAVSGKFEAKMVGGFRMEGAPEVEVVFGDTRAYRSRIDRFFDINASMKAQRQEFSRRVQASLALLVQTKRGCPKKELAPHYYEAHKAAEEYRRQGIQFEIDYSAITTLHRFGETQGLTPDYRWKVNRVTKTYRAALTDYREMQLALIDQLDKELSYRGCKQSTLLNLGKTDTVPPPVAYQAPVPKPRRTWRTKKTKPVVSGTMVTFFIDNRTCTEPLNVYADGVLLGEVPKRQRAAFQALAGNHVICLIGKGDARQCGQSGTVRTAYVHDGWAMTLHCRAK